MLNIIRTCVQSSRYAVFIVVIGQYQHGDLAAANTADPFDDSAGILFRETITHTQNSVVPVFAKRGPELIFNRETPAV